MVSAIIVTRGDHDLSEILRSLPPDWERLIWNNGLGQITRYWTEPPGSFERLATGLPDLAVYGRYAAIEYAKGDLIFVQDDDCVIERAAEIVHAWEVQASLETRTMEGYLHEWKSGNGSVTNMPAARWTEFPDWSLVGWGACFHRDLPAKAFERWGKGLPSEVRYPLEIGEPPLFMKECDAVFTTLTPHVKIDVGFRHLPWAEGPGRMFTEDPERHREERNRMVELARRVRDA